MHVEHFDMLCCVDFRLFIAHSFSLLVVVGKVGMNFSNENILHLLQQAVICSYSEEFSVFAFSSIMID
jgi:hypothetical protein